MGAPTTAQRAKLQAACDLVLESLRTGVPAQAIIADLVDKHGARHSTRWDGNNLRCAGISASCTWSADKGLLDNWRKSAVCRLMEEPAHA